MISLANTDERFMHIYQKFRNTVFGIAFNYTKSSADACDIVRTSSLSISNKILLTVMNILRHGLSGLRSMNAKTYDVILGKTDCFP